MQLAPLNPALQNRLGVPGTIRGGVVVTEVAEDSPAAEAGLEPGDVILQVDNEDVVSPREALRRLEATKEAVALLVWRKGDTFYRVLKPSASG
jgi:serine protease Do